MQRNADCYFTKMKRIITYILLFIQLFLPIFVASSSIAKATQTSEQNNPMMDTINGLNNLLQRPSEKDMPVLDKEKPESDKNNAPVKSSISLSSSDSALSMLEAHFSSQQPATAIQQPKNAEQDIIFNTLPTLGINDSEPNSQTAVSSEQQMAQNISQLAQTLSTDDAIKAYMGYARSIGENLVNQKIHDWLSQFGNARVQINSNKTGDVDLFVPVLDKPNSLLFSQIGIRANEHRNTTSLGVGYRQYQDAWMWGINSFYDYDITGSNSRFGVGGELWADYLKLTINGYFRLTDWHQSRLHEMRDYDERPANGFDLRAEGFLPSYPHLGAYAKYEKYYGDGISLNHGLSSSDLIDNPSATTFGLSYTPFPLLTFKTQISRGDTKESSIGMELAYRFGVLLAEQLDPDNVDLMRSLAGNRYDFVDRNYDIVMQYSKQELLSISLPESTDGEAAQTMPITVTVNKAKYGLKQVSWKAPELIAKGGNIQIVSPTSINLTLPAYIFQKQAEVAQSYPVSAVAVDNEGNQSNTAVMVIYVSPSQYTIRAMTLTPNNTQVANNSDAYVATALVQNKKHQALPGRAITFTIDGFKSSGVTLFDMDGNQGNSLTVITDSEGKANINIKSKVVGTGTLTAAMKNGNRNTIPVSFAPDIATAKVESVTLIGNETNNAADGISRFTFEALVTDQFNNPVPNVNVNWSHDRGNTAILSAEQSQTDENGRAMITMTSRVVVDNVTVSGYYNNPANKIAANKAVNFIYIFDTAKVGSVTLEGNETQKIADNNSFFTFTAQLVDGNDNPIKQKGLDVNWSHNKDSEVKLAAKSQTDENGRASVVLHSTTAAIKGVVVSARFGSTKRVDADHEVDFIADESFIRVKSVTLNDQSDSKLANGHNKFTFTALVLDGNDDPARQRTVNWAHNKNEEVKLSTTTSKTDENGCATIMLYSTNKAVNNIIVNASYGTSAPINAQPVEFYADSNMAQVGSVTLVDSEVNKVADGNNYFTFNAQLVDKYGHPLKKAGLNIEWSHNKEQQITLSAASTTTNDSGIASVTLKSSKIAVDDIIVYAKYRVPPLKPADKKVGFVGDIKTAKVGKIILNDADNNKIADGKNGFEFSTQLVDRNGNPVKQAGLVIKWRQEKGTIVSLPASSKTDSDGRSTITLKSSQKAVDNVVIYAKYGTSGEEKSEAVNFIANINTAKIEAVTLDDKVIDKVANGDNYFTFKAQLVDEFDNPIEVADLDISWFLDDDKAEDAHLSAASSQTNKKGFASIELKSTTKAVDNVVVSAQYGTAPKINAKTPVNFIADRATAKVGSVTLVDDIVRKVADGNNYFTFKAQLVDKYENPVKEPNLDVNWQQETNGNDVILPASSKTNSDGQATVELQSTKTAVSDIVVSARYDTSEKKDADKLVNFIQVSFSNLRVNGHNFNIGDGFPTTGFTDAKFIINTNGVPASEFQWSSSEDWVSVQNGTVIFKDRPASDKKTVTITAIHNTGGDPIKYKFTLQKWYIYSGEAMNWNSATNWCSRKAENMRLPTVQQITIRRFQHGIGSLWSEWGNTSFYGWNDHVYWTSEKSGNKDKVQVVGMVSGYIGAENDNKQLFFTCISDL